jgi:hypothetical protein
MFPKLSCKFEYGDEEEQTIYALHVTFAPESDYNAIQHFLEDIDQYLRIQSGVRTKLENMRRNVQHELLVTIKFLDPIDVDEE